MKKPRILIVDDSPAGVKAAKAALGKHFKTVVVGKGKEAVELASSSDRPDLILLNTVMPDATAYEVCERLQQHPVAREIPVILVTEKDGEEGGSGLEYGAKDCVTKPLNPDLVRARVSTQLELKRYRHDLDTMVYQRTVELRRSYDELKRLALSYERFVPKEFLSLLQKDSITHVRLGDQVQRDLTVCFADIRDFTKLSEAMNPQQNFDFLNSFLSRIAPLVIKHNGFIDKYIGDAIMALFPGRPSDAVDAAVHMMDAIKTYNGHRRNSGYAPIEMGIGMHTGTLILGTVGFKKRMEATVISDAVNVASRVETLTKIFGAQIIVTSDVLLSLGNEPKYAYRFLGRVTVKGKQNSVSIFEILDGLPDSLRERKLQTMEIFDRAMVCYIRDDFRKASLLFKEVLEMDPDDRAAALYLRKCNDAANVKIVGQLLDGDYKAIQGDEEG